MNLPGSAEIDPASEVGNASSQCFRTVPAFFEYPAWTPFMKQIAIPLKSQPMPKIKAFVNGRVCFHDQCPSQSIYVDEETGMIVQQPAEMPTDFVDLKDNVLAPAYLELQTNGSLGFHFTAFKKPHVYQEDLKTTSRHLVRQGVAGFYVTLPTVHQDVFTEVPTLHVSPFVRLLCMSVYSMPFLFYRENLKVLSLVIDSPQLFGTMQAGGRIMISFTASLLAILFASIAHSHSPVHGLSTDIRFTVFGT